MIDAWAYVARCWRPLGCGLGPVIWAVDWTQARALLDLAGLLPVAPDVLDGLLWIEDGAREEMASRREREGDD